MAMQKDVDLICQMAAYHCMTMAALTEAEKQGKPTTELEGEAKRAYEALVAALSGAGYLARYLDIFPDYSGPAGDRPH